MLRRGDLDSVGAIREAARRRVPKAVWAFIEGGAEDESTVRANVAAFSRLWLIPHAFRDVTERRLATTIGGVEVTAPIMVAPAGLLGPVHPDGELAGIVAAADLGLIGVASPMSTYTIEELVAGCSRPPWFNLFPFGDRGRMLEFMDRAAAAGCPGLVFTSDMVAPGNRERDRRAGFIAPPKLNPANLLDAARHPAWTTGLLRHRRVTLRNFDPGPVPLRRMISAATTSTRTAIRTLNASVTWDDLAFIRERWKGPLGVKGPTSAEDARRLVDHGVDVIIVGNHGGRQLDYVRSALDQLREVVDAVGGEAVDVVLDGGVRRGSDIAKALALGARACMVGRAWVYGLAAAGTSGANLSLSVLIRELDNTLALLGASSVDALDASYVRSMR